MDFGFDDTQKIFVLVRKLAEATLASHSGKMS